MLRVFLTTLTSALLAAGLLIVGTGCQQVQQTMQALTSMAGQYLVSDSTIHALGYQTAVYMDGENTVLPESDPRVARVRHLLAEDFDASVYDLQVYLSDDVNAFALPNGSIRVFSGLLELYQDDDELRFVLGHEVGHVILGHSRQQIVREIGMEAGQEWLAKQESALRHLGEGISGDLVGKIVQAQFSQQDETAADDFALGIMLEKKYNAGKAATALRKLSSSSKNISLLSSHPDPEVRAQRLEERTEAAGVLTGQEMEAFEREAQRLSGEQSDNKEVVPTSPSRDDEQSVDSTAKKSPVIDVRLAQQMLNERGYGCGPADGILGSRTRACIRAFQEDNKLDPTGRIDEKTMALLQAY